MKQVLKNNYISKSIFENIKWKCVLDYFSNPLTEYVIKLKVYSLQSKDLSSSTLFTMKFHDRHITITHFSLEDESLSDTWGHLFFRKFFP